MIEERRPVDLIAADGSIVPGEFSIHKEAAGRPDPIRLTLNIPGRAFTATAGDGFEALILIRRALEAIGLTPLCWGASLQVYPSDASRGEGLGEEAYRLTVGRFPTVADRINIFAAGPGLVASTVADQEDFSRAWFDSLAMP